MWKRGRPRALSHPPPPDHDSGLRQATAAHTNRRARDPRAKVVTTESPRLPRAAGAMSDALLAQLRREPSYKLALPEPSATDLLGDDDFQLALYVLYELHYRGFADVTESWEWNPGLLGFRAELEQLFLEHLVGHVGPPSPGGEPAELDLHLRAVLDADDGPSLSRYVEIHADLAQFREFVIHRSAYQLKEADPHSWALPRLAGVAKAAMVEIQSDEYGEGELDAMHSELFATTMAELGLDPNYGAYLSRLPGSTLATVNLMSFFGLHRRWRGAIVGHLAAFEMSSSVPNRRYSNGLRRLGVGPTARRFYDVHVTADAVHEQVAAVDLAGGLARQDPAVVGDILFGARAVVALDAAFAAYVLERWRAGESSLRADYSALSASDSRPLSAEKPIVL